MITKEEIENIAMLAKLSVTQEEYPALVSDLQQMVDFADTVRCAHININMAEAQEEDEGFFAQDEVCDSYCRDELLANAPLRDGEFFVVRKRA